MLTKETFAMIKALHERGVYQQDIAQQVGVHPKTVSRALARGTAPSVERTKPGSKLDAYKATVDRLLGEGVWNAVVIHREIQAEGYTGGITTLRMYIIPKRSLRPTRATVRFETAPGRQMQSDWGEIETTIAGVLTKVYFIPNLLGFSRRMHFWCAPSLDSEHTFEGLIRAFEYFGGVTEEVLVDNQKVAVFSHLPKEGPRFQERFLDLAGHYGFTPKACRPYRARTKGKDERAVGYIKQHFFVRYRSFENWAHLNQQAEAWLAQEADPRVHGTTNEVVLERFGREAPTLKALPALRYDTSYRETRTVSYDAFVDVRGNRYSVPAVQCGSVVAVRIGVGDERLRVFAGDVLVAEHRLQQTKGENVVVKDHHRILWEQALPVARRELADYEEASRWN